MAIPLKYRPFDPKHPRTSAFEVKIRLLVAKRKKGNIGKKERVSKQKLLKGQGQNVTALAILERLELEACQPTIVVDNTFHSFMVPPL